MSSVEEKLILLFERCRRSQYSVEAPSLLNGNLLKFSRAEISFNSSKETFEGMIMNTGASK